MKMQKSIESVHENSTKENNDTLLELTVLSVNAIREAVRTVEQLSKRRGQQKLSNNRTNGIARELKELEKVLALYC